MEGRTVAILYESKIESRGASDVRLVAAPYVGADDEMVLTVCDWYEAIDKGDAMCTFEDCVCVDGKSTSVLGS